MPQIRCPNCGTSINLANRRELDHRIIVKALEKGSKSFTDLLKMTGLPRKTLSMRLAALRDSGVIVKDGSYHLNGSAHLERRDEKMVSPESQLLAKPPLFTRKRMLLMMMMLVIGVPVAAQVSAMLFASPPASSPPQPSYIGTFKMDINISNTNDLFAWQALIHFYPSELVFIEAAEGDFLKDKAPYGTHFVFANDTGPGELLVYGCRLGMDVPGISGTGTLATITFGYKSETYALPEIAYNGVFDTWLWNSNLENTAGTLKMEPTEG